MRGTLFLVVGPSGAGKDSLIDGVRARLAVQGRHIFARRVVTRPAGAGGENHMPASQAAFARMDAAGEFALSWRANGLGYGIPKTIADDLAAGRHVIANVSRLIVPRARELFQPLRVIVVTAPPDVIAKRLAARGRETQGEIAARLGRGSIALPDGPDVRVVMNDSDLAEGVAEMLEILAEPLTV
jgi:phosphonate metabolism protein PhnN/1,5-bisphosphokinase (PRPP-forming)